MGGPLRLFCCGSCCCEQLLFEKKGGLLLCRHLDDGLVGGLKLPNQYPAVKEDEWDKEKVT